MEEPELPPVDETEDPDAMAEDHEPDESFGEPDEMEGDDEGDSGSADPVVPDTKPGDDLT
jgi:hypothetical protein